jgi:hypothetical protein
MLGLEIDYIVNSSSSRDHYKRNGLSGPR